MSSIEDIERRISSLESNRAPIAARILELLLTPIILLVIGFLLNSKLEETRQSAQSLELQVRRIDAAKGLVGEFFSGTTERGLIAEQLLSRLVDDSLAQSIKTIVTNYYAAKYATATAQNDSPKVAEIRAATEAVSSPASKELAEKINDARFYVIVDSRFSEKSALARADSVSKLGFSAIAILSTTGAYGVSIGDGSSDEMRPLLESARKAGVARAFPWSYLMPSSRYRGTVLRK